MQILDGTQISRKIARLAVEILEQHEGHERIFLLGINNNGYTFAQLLKAGIEQLGQPLDIQLHRVKLSPANPKAEGTVLEGDLQQLDGEHIILVDDVANTGRTAFYAAKPLLDILPASLQVCVLIDRMHKTWPVSSDYVGLSLSTTVQQDIRVYFDADNWRAEIF